MAIPRGLFPLAKELARHLLRRPVVGVAAAARTRDGRWLLIRRGDTGEWALPGGTLEWGERLRPAVVRELLEETGAPVLELGRLVGVFSAPHRDPRFHAVTVLVEATVGEPGRAPLSAWEIREVRLFDAGALPSPLAHGMADMVAQVARGTTTWE